MYWENLCYGSKLEYISIRGKNKRILLDGLLWNV